MSVSVGWALDERFGRVGTGQTYVMLRYLASTPDSPMTNHPSRPPVCSILKVVLIFIILTFEISHLTCVILF
jgi:hypothetical protein